MVVSGGDCGADTKEIAWGSKEGRPGEAWGQWSGKNKEEKYMLPAYQIWRSGGRGGDGWEKSSPLRRSPLEPAGSVLKARS